MAVDWKDIKVPKKKPGTASTSNPNKKKKSSFMSKLMEEGMSFVMTELPGTPKDKIRGKVVKKISEILPIKYIVIIFGVVVFTITGIVSTISWIIDLF